MSGEKPAGPDASSSPVEQADRGGSEPREREGPKPEVRIETWKRWTRFVLESIGEPKELSELHAAAGRERVSPKRVDGILAVLEEAGLAVVSEGKAHLSERQKTVSVALDIEKLSKELREKETEVAGLRSRVTGLEAEVESLKAGVRGLQCQRLKPLDIEGHSGQRLFYCTVRGLSMGERAELCLVCEERVPPQPEQAKEA